MPRRAYVAELNKLTESVSIPGILSVCSGDDDGEFKVTISPDNGTTKFVVSGLIPDLSEYPSNHDYHLFVDDDAAPAFVGRTVERLADTSGRDLGELLNLLSKSFLRVDGDGDAMMEESQPIDETYDDFEAEFSEEEDDFFATDRPAARKVQSSTKIEFTRFSEGARARVKADLQLAYGAGFKVGYHGALQEGGNCYVTVSCRVSKLGISEEAMQAWELEGTEYLVLLIHYPMGYKTVDEFRKMDPYTTRTNVSFRVGVMKGGKEYKPALAETIRVFAELSAGADSQQSQSLDSAAAAPPTGWRDVFISKPLNVLFNERFVNILKYRYMGMPWQGAERFYNDVQGKNFDIGNSDYLDNVYTEEEVTHKSFPHFVTADHLKDAPPGSAHSLPLLAMQFLLRHFVRCPEFCLVCHCKLDDDLEALKPYVCNKDLCLFQYMSLGFGPSIEHEIISQPYVVDLLISFCYTSAVGQRLNEFPSGLGLSVPPTILSNDLPGAVYGYQIPPPNQVNQVNQTTSSVGKPADIKKLEARFDANTNELIFADKSAICPLRPGKWIALRYGSDNLPRVAPVKHKLSRKERLKRWKDRLKSETNSHSRSPREKSGDEDKGKPTYHGRVLETTYWPIVKVSELQAYGPKKTNDSINGTPSKDAKPQAPEPLKGIDHVHVWTYDVDFDTLSPQDKRASIVSLLDRLPTVKEMRQYLIGHKNASLDRWKDRMPDACLQVLRWIIASNRACIVQVDSPEDVDQSSKKTSKKSEERVFGMKGWLQFRFAMGAPDKERRFLDSVQANRDRLNLKYPTIFAWHGSPLQNWHSIIREGLHFKDTLHGRAYGHGVYFSTDYNVSTGYSGHYYRGNGVASNCWPHSELQIATALSLNEIVNAPAEYVSQNPYLVVDKLDWIQTRYLFVQVQNEDWKKLDEKADCKPSDTFIQDPSRRVQGANGKIEIPITAISRSRRDKTSSIPRNDGGSKKKLKFSGTMNDPIDLDDDDNLSVVTDAEDRAMLMDNPVVIDDDEPVSTKSSGFSFGGSKKGKQSLMDGVRSFIAGSRSSKSLTDFVPGQLDYSTLTLLPPPPFANSAATNRLHKDYQTVLKVQNSTPPHELGWFTDQDQFGDNVYQWIIELHSFEESLPLARQLKDRGLKSVVLEMRFGANYPMEPPFVRVIKPRFLPFNSGGGGHVTAGGSICMELLTNSGWSAVSSIESVLLQVRMAISSREPKPAQLESGGRGGGMVEYGVGEAVDAYVRACQVHGWRVPQGFREMAFGGK